MISSLASRPADELFHFHPRSTNPELWRTTVPLVVRERCKRHKGLVATWTAIHWLIVLHAASGRAHFGMREIAEEAGVGRNELAGPTGHIQRLVDLGLVRIVGYKAFRGLREPRPVYHIDLVELERLSLDLVPDVLREHHIDRPPPAAPDPRQLRLTLVPTDEDTPAELDKAFPVPPSHRGGTVGEQGGAITSWSRQGRHENRTAEELTQAGAAGSTPAPRQPTHPNRTASNHLTPHTGTGMHVPGADMHGNGTALPDHERAVLEIRQTMHPTGTGQARNRDMDGGNERTNEGVSHALTPAFFQSLITETTRTVLAALQIQGALATPEHPPVLSTAPPAPAGTEPLNAPILTLWQGDQPTLRRRDVHQLALLAAEYDGPTGGHGAYWLGRAILMADLCLGDREQPITIAYVRRMLRRWCEEGSWGSDREVAESPLHGASEPAPRRRTTEPPLGEIQQHPAIIAYIETLRETPNSVQAAQIAETVVDLEPWRQVLKDWQLNGWGERSVGKMLDRYQKTRSATTPAPEPPPSIAVIHTYPNLTAEQRERWIRRFHAAATPSEKRAVVTRLEQEHPR